MALTARTATVDCADGLRLGLQRVPEPKPGKNRVQVDWTAADRAAEVSRLLADPDGNEFCVAGQG